MKTAIMLNTIKMLFLFVFLSIPLTIQAATTDDQDITPLTQPSARSNKGVVSIITGSVNGTYIRIASELATVLDTDGLRILAIIGKGSVQNISDLLYLKGIDLAIVQSDVLEYLKTSRYL